MTDEKTLAILAEIRAYYQRNGRLPGDVTVDDVAADIGKTKETARVLLNRLVKDGALIMAVVMDGSRKVRVFRKKASPD